MAWTVKISDTAERQMSRLDKPVAKRLLKFLRERLASIDNPRSIGAPLTGSKFGELWKYRQGDYRIIARIQDDAVEILVVTVGHRREIYRK